MDDASTSLPQMKDMLLEGPDSQVSSPLKSIIKKWDETPTAIQILEALDIAVRCGAASGFVIVLMEGELRSAIVREGTTYEEVVAKATWRNE